MIQKINSKSFFNIFNRKNRSDKQRKILEISEPYNPIHLNGFRMDKTPELYRYSQQQKDIAKDSMSKNSLDSIVGSMSIESAQCYNASKKNSFDSGIMSEGSIISSEYISNNEDIEHPIWEDDKKMEEHLTAINPEFYSTSSDYGQLFPLKTEQSIHSSDNLFKDDVYAYAESPVVDQRSKQEPIYGIVNKVNKRNRIQYNSNALSTQNNVKTQKEELHYAVSQPLFERYAQETQKDFILPNEKLKKSAPTVPLRSPNTCLTTVINDPNQQKHKDINQITLWDALEDPFLLKVRADSPLLFEILADSPLLLEVFKELHTQKAQKKVVLPNQESTRCAPPKPPRLLDRFLTNVVREPNQQEHQYIDQSMLLDIERRLEFTKNTANKINSITPMPKLRTTFLPQPNSKSVKEQPNVLQEHIKEKDNKSLLNNKKDTSINEISAGYVKKMKDKFEKLQCENSVQPEMPCNLLSNTTVNTSILSQKNGMI